MPSEAILAPPSRETPADMRRPDAESPVGDCKLDWMIERGVLDVPNLGRMPGIAEKKAVFELSL
ncbi:MAG: hypothetical protein LBU32_25095 [Clostridiales bacterium]|nr:hypothetical protein [Clostridiales bacterium]